MFRVATIIPNNASKRDSGFDKVSAGIKRYVFWVLKFAVPFVYCHEITTSRVMLHNEKCDGKITNLANGRFEPDNPNSDKDETDSDDNSLDFEMEVSSGESSSSETDWIAAFEMIVELDKTNY